MKYYYNDILISSKNGEKIIDIYYNIIDLIEEKYYNESINISMGLNMKGEENV